MDAWEEFCIEGLGIALGALDDPAFDLLAALGVARAEIEAARSFCCGAMILEGAPHLKPEHLPVFDCANPCGRSGKRALSVDGHIRMMAAAESSRRRQTAWSPGPRIAADAGCRTAARWSATALSERACSCRMV